ncbi:hypothetical protein DPMN_070444 [Dreissena polymorpha]|uniref:Uncharacterized protein n=1 Tax=Dreissena polymorpha TaxID=45954 RepID=A0A9D3Z5B8_DREPO|nr:hypothetical protein DPMN_070444 [Dreissena polymorpha]
MDDEMTTDDKLMLMRCQLLLQVETVILIAKAKLRQRNRKFAKIFILTSELNEKENQLGQTMARQ